MAPAIAVLSGWNINVAEMIELDLLFACANALSRAASLDLG